MAKDLATLTAEAVVRMARDACTNRDCGAEGRGQAGPMRRPARCRECPMDAVDPVWAALVAQMPPGNVED